MLERKIRITKIFDDSIPFREGQFVRMAENENSLIMVSITDETLIVFNDSVVKENWPTWRSTATNIIKLEKYSFEPDAYTGKTYNFIRERYQLKKRLFVQTAELGAFTMKSGEKRQLNFGKEEILFQFVFAED